MPFGRYFDAEPTYSPHLDRGGSVFRERGVKLDPLQEYNKGELAGSYFLRVPFEHKGRKLWAPTAFVRHRNPYTLAQREDHPRVLVVGASGFGCPALPDESYFSPLIKELYKLNPNIIAFDYMHPGMLQREKGDTKAYPPFATEALEMYSIINQPYFFRESVNTLCKEILDVDMIDGVSLIGSSMGSLSLVYGSDLDAIPLEDDRIIRSISGSVIAGLGSDVETARFLEPLRSRLHTNINKLPHPVSRTIFSQFVRASHFGWSRFLHLPKDDSYFREAVASVPPSVLGKHTEDLLHNMDDILLAFSDLPTAPIDNVFVGRQDMVVNSQAVKTWAKELRQAKKRGVEVIEMDADHVPERNLLHAKHMAGHMLPQHLR